MITLTTNKLLFLNQSLEKLVKYTEEHPISFSTSYRIARIATKVESSLSEYFKKRDSLILKYGKELFEKDKDGNTIMIKDKDGNNVPKKTGAFAIEPFDENFIKYNEDNNVLLNQEVELTNVFPMSVKEFDEIKISLSTMPGLFFILKEEIDEKNKEEKEAKEKEVKEETKE